MPKKLLYVFLASTLMIFIGISSRATTIVPQLMLLLGGNDAQQISQINTATYDEVRLDLITLE